MPLDTVPVQPANEAELTDALRGAKSVAIAGGGTCGIEIEAETRLETSKLSGISLYEPGALTLVAQSGTPLAEIEAALDAENQRLAFEPPNLAGILGRDGSATLGGVFATNASGPRRLQAGAARDFLLGVRLVDGAGNCLKNGGRVMKNVTGYDLVKLMAGAHGTLGVLTEVSLKTQPKPETRACVLINGLDNETAVKAMSRAMASPFEVSGAAHAPKGVDGHPVTMLRLEGFEASVAYRAKELLALLAPSGGHAAVESDPEAVRAGWIWVRDVQLFEGGQGDLWRISVKPSDGPGLVDRLPDGSRVLFDWAGGLIWVECASGTDLRAKIAPFAGHATRLRGAGGTIPRFEPQNEVVTRLSEDLRRKFDPRGILNPGLMG